MYKIKTTGYNALNPREYNTQRAGNIIGNILGVPRSKGASLSRQHQWARMPPQQQMLMRRKYKDSDRDGVPDRWDCQRKNPFRQEEIQDDEGYSGDDKKEDIYFFYGGKNKNIPKPTPALIGKRWNNPEKFIINGQNVYVKDMRNRR